MLLASPDTSFTRHWYVTVDRNVRGVSPAEVEDVVEDVLNDPMGWKRMGYHFKKIAVSQARSMHPRAVFHIRLCHPSVVMSQCNIRDRSCADLRENKIYLNADRWAHGAPIAKLTLDQYRRALVGHEVGHLLSFDHVTCPGQGSQGDVMQEFTRLGWQGCTSSIRPTLTTRQRLSKSVRKSVRKVAPQTSRNRERR